ncbi:MAG: hypothetical protein ACREX4_24980, partial [Gammaproteobacteria bacterium]
WLLYSSMIPLRIPNPVRWAWYYARGSVLFQNQDIGSKAKNRFQQDVHRHGTMKRPFSTHSSTPCLLERRMSGDPHTGHTCLDSRFTLSYRRCKLSLLEIAILTL